MTPRTVERFAVRLAASGIAAGAIASRHIAALCGYPNAIGLDMGGTSTDISLVYEGEVRVTKEWFVEYGYPICFPSIEVLTIGAGGGSLAWIDEAGSLRNGPQSAGADPGPACYGAAATQATNTDANVVLGRLGAELIGGAMHARSPAAAARGRGRRRAAQWPRGARRPSAVIQVANANMADAVRLISIRRGYDPRDFALVVFGGAGPLHGAALAHASCRSRPCSCRRTRASPRRSAACWSTSATTSSTMFLRRADEADPAEVEARVREARGRGARAARSTRASRGADEPPAVDRHALPRASGDRCRCRVVGAGRVPAAVARVPRRARAGVHLPPRRRAGRDLPAELPAVGVTPKPELARHEPSPADAARADARATSGSTRPTAVSTRRSTGATTCPPASRSRARP